MHKEFDYALVLGQIVTGCILSDFLFCEICATFTWSIGLFQKKIQIAGGVRGWGGVGLRIYLFENPLKFSFFYFTPGNSRQNKAQPWIFHKILLDPLEILRPESKTPGSSTLFFVGHPWKFHFVFN